MRQRQRESKRRISSNHNYYINNSVADCVMRRKRKRTSGTDPDDIINPVEVELKDDHQGQVPCHECVQMPQKHVLQLIIDILQRRDTYEIFAEPVDPNEVENYYQIVKEPMDFGTMRAKLHEGMYQNLDQFKRDVFLITSNAMHFNSSATIYFRQARAIQELAKRIFHVLVTAPQNFELKFSGTRRRSTRTPTLVKPSNVAFSDSPKGTTSSVGTSILKKNVRGSPWMTGLAVQTKRNYCGTTDDRKSDQVETDRRCTYRPKSYPFGHDNDPVGSKCFLSNRLIPTNEQDSKYTKSLSSFVKDLGPTAKMIATLKIGGSHESYPFSRTGAQSTGLGFRSPECEVADAPSHSSRRCTGLKPTAIEMNVVGKVGGGEDESSKKRIPKRRGGVGAGEDTASTGRENGKVMQKHDGTSTEFWVGSVTSSPEACGGKGDENVLPVVLALEHSHYSHYSHSHANDECKRRKKKSCSSKGASGVQQSRASCSSEVNNLGCLKVYNRAGHLDLAPSTLDEENEERECGGGDGRPFTFNLGFLKAQLQLYQMNMKNVSAVGRD